MGYPRLGITALEGLPVSLSHRGQMVGILKTAPVSCLRRNGTCETPYHAALLCLVTLYSRMAFQYVEPSSCDTFVALPPATLGNRIIFGKNSDRPSDEVQEIVYFPATTHLPGEKVEVRTKGLRR